MLNWNKYLLIGFLAVLGAACSSTKEPGADQSGQAADTSEARGSADQQAGISSDPLNDPSSPLSKRVVYFDFDSASIKPEDREVILAHAQHLSANSGMKIILEGHADERGTREYNIALGERRAKAVQQLMTLQGVAGSQIEVISFGEERPVAMGHDESAWSQNRRVEILYPGN